MNSEELRKKFLDFFREKGHAIIDGATLVPEHDPTVLFTTAGMHPLVPYLLGEKHPAGKRLANIQKCIRTGDIDEVGDDVHLTFFEMLGNWSLGDYWKKEAIEWSWEFLTDKKWLGLDKNLIAVSVFEGDTDAPFDKEAYDIWKNNIEITEKRIGKLPKDKNWWGPAGKTGPCGPDTEMFYWTGNLSEVPEVFDDENPLWVEIWNDVFMQYNKTAEGKYEPLKQKNVDTGMGVERTIAVLNGLKSVYETELFKPIIEAIKSRIPNSKFQTNSNGQNSKLQTKAIRIIADHIKAASFIMAEGVEPSNVERGYVLRRLIRRAVRYGKQIGIKDVFTSKISKVVIEVYSKSYPELSLKKNFIEEQLNGEEEKFIKTIDEGVKAFRKLLSRKGGGGITKPNSLEWGTFDIPEITGKDLFMIFSTYGFPLEMCLEELKDNIYILNKPWNPNRESFEIVSVSFYERLIKEFNEEFAKHQELSRTATAGVFKSGLADHSEQVTKYHTATHLLLAALRQVLGEHVFQKGSNITAERLRIDFSHSEKMTTEQIKQVENLVNQKIREDLPVKMGEMTVDQAKQRGAMGVFESKYGEKVKVYTIGPSTSPGQVFSKEICAGPHIEHTGLLGKFKITKEESSSAGIRRIKAILE